MAVKVFSGGPDFKSLRREIDVVKSLPHHENIVRLYNVEEDVRAMFTIMYIYWNVCIVVIMFSVFLFQSD